MLPWLIWLCVTGLACRRSSPRPAPREPFPKGDFVRVDGLRLRGLPAEGQCPMETHPSEFLSPLLPFLREAGEARRP